MKFVGKLEYLTPKILKLRRQKLSYYRITVVDHEGGLETLALTPVEYMKARKRCHQGILYVKPSLFMRIYAQIVKLFSKKQKFPRRR